jgi:L-ascorbate metabolism protein UlaG (beta-lactamase superfamily)
MASVKITHIGHASFKLESEQGTTIYFDPWLASNSTWANPTTDLTLADIDKADIVIATHGHIDHVGDSYEICKKTGALFVGSFELHLVGEKNCGFVWGETSFPLNPGGTTKIKDCTITMTQAHHSLSMSPGVVKEQHEAAAFHPDGAVSGYVMAFDNGVTVYDSSDTCLFSDMQLIGQMYTPQVAILPVGGLFTMGIREAARAASYIRPDVVIPCHYGDKTGQPCDINELSKYTTFLAPNTKVVEVPDGKSLTYTASSYAVES